MNTSAWDFTLANYSAVWAFMVQLGLLLLFLMLPTLVELLLARTTWQICSFFAELLGCDGEKRLLDEFASINGYLIAAVAICSSVLFLTFTLLTHCAVALA